jgi:hypothetical protein
MLIPCATCGEPHDIENVSWGFNEPRQWWSLSDEERANSELSSDWCIIESRDEGTSFYIRGLLEFTIQPLTRILCFGVWSSLSEKSFVEIETTWRDPERVKLGPYFGWLSNALPFVPDSMYLPCSVIQREPGRRPLIELHSGTHPLVQFQERGLYPDDLQSIFKVLMHSQS